MLVIVTRRIGDVLLTTPLIRTIKRAWPDAIVDALVFAGTEGALASNPDVRNVRTVPERIPLLAHLRLFAAIFRRYDIALSVVPSDRPTLYAWLAGKWRAGLIADEPKHRWKRWLLQRWVRYDGLNTHTVRMHLSLATALGIEPHAEVVAAWSPRDRLDLEQAFPGFALESFAVLHTFPRFNYKMWPAAGWIEVARWLQAQGLLVVLSGGNEPAEREHVAQLARELPGCVDLSGQLTLAQTACLIAHARAYVGPDTAPTHLAAATGVPVVALYGPSDPVKWGPWPARHPAHSNPWRRLGSQTAANVALVQGLAACVPCLKEGCDRHIASYSDCLLQLKPQTVIAALERALAMPSQRIAHDG